MSELSWRIALPLPDAAIELSPRWGQFSDTWQCALFLLASFLPAILIVGLYRYELRLVSRFAAAALLGLRLVFFALLWCLICLRPILAHVTTERLPSRLAIAVDRSQSMDFADPQRSTVDALRLARALRLHGHDNAARVLIDSWITHHEKDETPPTFADQAQRVLYDELFRKAAALTRGEITRLILAEDGLNLLGRLAADHQIELVGFDRSAWGVSESTGLFTGGVSTQRSTGTDLRAPLKQIADGKGELLGMILLSDGRHTAVESPHSRTPIYAVGVGAARPPVDIAVVELKAPSSVFKDADAHLEARLRITDVAAQDLIVELREPGKAAPLDSRIIKHHGAVDSYTVEFQKAMKERGNHAFEVVVRASKEIREITAANNALPTLVRVVEDKSRVLLVDGEARWEYQYLANALLRDETIELERVLFEQPRIGKTAEAELEKSGPKRKLPEVKDNVDPLLDFDCIILGDVAPEHLPPMDRKRLEKFVGERGGTLILSAGKRHLPMAYAKESGGGEVDPLVKLLPITTPQVMKLTAGFKLQFTHDGSATPFLQMDPAPERNTQQWAKMPAHFWGVVGKLKPGATSLVYVDEKIAEPVASVERPETSHALFARQSYGFGKVLYLGVDSTWRWRYRAGDLYHHRFWGQVARWAAADKLLPGGNRQLRFGSREPLYHEGQAAEILVRLNAETPLLAKDAAASARLIHVDDKGQEKEAATIPLQPSTVQPRLLQGQAVDLAAGNYRIKLAIPSLEDTIKGGAEAAFTVAPATPRELRDLSSNWPILEDLAKTSRGKYYTAENVEQLVDILTRKIITREHRDEQRLWQDAPLVWWVLAALLLLVTAEWIGRKLAGLP